MLVYRAVLALTAGLTVPSIAPAALPVQTELSEREREAFGAQVESVGALILEGKGKAALASIETLLPRATNATVRAGLLRLKMIALLLDGREPDAIVAMRASAAADPDSGILANSVEIGGEAGANALVIAAVRQMLETDDAGLSALSSNAVFGAVRWLENAEGKAATDQFVLALARASTFARHPDDQDWLRLRALERHWPDREAAVVRALAVQIRSREPLTQLLIDRRYAALWPELERVSGDRMQSSDAAAIAAAQQQVRAFPDDVGARHGLLTALHVAGLLDEADRIGRAVTVDASLTERTAWLVNDHSRVLTGMGRFADADARLVSVTALPIADRPWLISMMINRATWLVRAGNWRAAEGPLAHAEREVVKYGSPYAQQILRNLRLCVTMSSGGPDVARLIDELMRHEKDGHESTINGLMCAERYEAAAAVAVRWLDDPDRRTNALTALQPAAAVAPVGPSIWRAGFDRIAREPAVRAAIERYGRILPDRLLRREAR